MVTLGFTGSGSMLVTLAAIAGFAAACGIGLLMPYLGVERTPVSTDR